MDVPRSIERRIRRRIELKAAVQFCRGIADQVDGSSVGETRDLSTGGVLVTTPDPGPFATGEILTASIDIPWQHRRLFPYARLIGSCQIVRSQQLPNTSFPKRWSLALEFCANRSL